MKVKVIGGLFESQAALGSAIESLNSRGYQHLAYSIVGTADQPEASQPRPDGGQGLFHALRRMGISGAHAEYYMQGILQGQVLLVMHGVDSVSFNEIQSVLRQQGAQFPHQRHPQ
jgi:hypothetical protein